MISTEYVPGLYCRVTLSSVSKDQEKHHTFEPHRGKGSTTVRGSKRDSQSTTTRKSDEFKKRIYLH